MTMIAVLGPGKDHSKFSPCLFYLGYPEPKAGKDANVKECVANSKAFSPRKEMVLKSKMLQLGLKRLEKHAKKRR